MARFLKNPDLTRSGKLAARLPVVPNNSYGDAPVDGLIRFNQATSRIEFYYNNNWSEVAKIGTVQLLTDIIGTSNGLTTQIFTMQQAESDPTAVAVFVGGVYQQPTSYSVSGTNITFSAPPPAPTGMSRNEIVVIHNINSTNVPA